MTNEKISERIKNVIARQKGIKEVEEITLNTSFRRDLEFDSLALVDLTLACEDEFDIEIPAEDKEFEKVDTIQQAIDYFKERLSG